MDRRSFILGAAAAVATCRQAPMPRSYLQSVIDEYGDTYSDSVISAFNVSIQQNLDVFASRIAIFSNVKGMNIDKAGHLFVWRGPGADPWGKRTPHAEPALKSHGGGDHAEPGEGYSAEFRVCGDDGPEHDGGAEHGEGREFDDHS